MREGLVGRVKRLMAGSLNSVVDAVEMAAPEAVLKQAIRETEEALDEVQHELGRTIVNKHHAASRLAAANDKHEELSRQIEFAVGEGRDDLAEAAIARQLDIEAQMPILESALHDFSATESELEGYVEGLKARRREMQEDLDEFLRAQQREGNASAVAGAPGSPPTPGVKAARADRAFDRVLKNATGVGATERTDRETAAKLDELSRIERENRIKERLARVRAARTPDS